MFEGIGEKIKVLAKIVAVVGVLASTIVGFLMMESFGYGNELIGVVVIIFGSISSLIASFLIYGFGHLIINSDIVASAINPKEYYYRQEYTADVPYESYDDDEK